MISKVVLIPQRRCLVSNMIPFPAKALPDLVYDPVSPKAKPDLDHKEVAVAMVILKLKIPLFGTCENV